MKKVLVIGLLAVMSLTACNSASGQQENTAAETAETTVEQSGQETQVGQTEQNGTESTGVPEETAATAATADREAEPAYHVETKEKTWSTEDGIAASTVKLEYPVLEGEDQAYQKINEYFKKWADDVMKGYEEDTSEDAFVKTSLEFREGYPGDEMPAWESAVSVNSVIRYKDLLDVYQDSYIYEGGAHGMPGRINHLLNAKTGEPVNLAEQIDITPEQLNELVRGKFLELVQKDTEGRFFEDAAQTLEAKTDFLDHYYLAKDGVVFYSEPYEIAPYAAGYTEVTIPFEELGM